MESISLKNYFKDLRKLDVLNAKEQTKRAILAKKGDEKAKTELVSSNLRFVVSIAKEYHYENMPLLLEDLINEGNLGLLRAINKFDEKKGFNFISYAVWWIRQAIIQFIYDNGSVVRLPVNRINMNIKIKKAKQFLYHELNREPSDKEISNFTGIKMTDIKLFNSECGHKRDEYLDADVSEDSDSKFVDFVEGDGGNNIEVDLNKESLRNEINSVLETLSDRENNIINMYFGLNGKQEMTLSEIGEVLNLTNERVRQIKDFALKKLRCYNKSIKFKEYLE